MIFKAKCSSTIVQTRGFYKVYKEKTPNNKPPDFFFIDSLWVIKPRSLDIKNTEDPERLFNRRKAFKEA